MVVIPNCWLQKVVHKRKKLFFTCITVATVMVWHIVFSQDRIFRDTTKHTFVVGDVIYLSSNNVKQSGEQTNILRSKHTKPWYANSLSDYITLSQETQWYEEIEDVRSNTDLIDAEGTEAAKEHGEFCCSNFYLIDYVCHVTLDTFYGY